jgi:hypothetical protein
MDPDSVLYHGKGTDDLFLPITSNYRFIGYEILPDYGVFDIYKSPDIPRAIEEYRQHLGILPVNFWAIARCSNSCRQFFRSGR